MNPTPGDLHVNGPLTNVSLAFSQDASAFVANRVFPNIPVNHKSDVYYTYEKGEFMRDQAEERAPATESAGGGFTIGTDDYSCKVWAIHKDVDDQSRANADSQFNLDSDATEWVTEQLMIRREKLFVNTFMQGGVWGYDYDGVAGSPGANEVRQWSDYTNSDPLKNVEDAQDAVHIATGKRPNVMVIGRQVWSALKHHPDLIDRVKYSGGVGNDRPAKVTLQALADLMELDEILVMDATENTAKEGQTPSFSFIGGKTALLAYRAASPGLKVASAGYTFSWTGYLGATSEGTRIKKFRKESIESDRIEGSMAHVQKVVSSELGAFFDTIVA